MQIAASNPHDEDLVKLVDTLNAGAGRVVARITADTDRIYDSLTSVLPRRATGVDWERAVFCSGPLPGDPPEAISETIQRVLSDFRKFCSLALMSEEDHLFLLSDDYYDNAIDCEFRFADCVLKDWLPLPQGIFVVPNNLICCMLVTFSRSSFVFCGGVAGIEDAGRPSFHSP